MEAERKEALGAAACSALPVGPPIILTKPDLDLCRGSRELLPCPFCGHIYPMSHGERTPNGKAICWKITCTKSEGLVPVCSASIWFTDRDQDKARAGAVAKWNRRPPPNSEVSGNDSSPRR